MIQENWGFARRVIIKAALLFALVNGLYLILQPMPLLQRLTIYNTLIPGRERFPYSENPPESYNLTLLDLDGMFASHEYAHASDENYNVILLGDSSVWGWLLEPDQTLSACLNQLDLHTSTGQLIQVYNLGYPLLNVTKDLLILDRALEKQPDMVVWMVTLASLYPQDQLYHAMVQANPDTTRQLINDHQLALDPALLPAEPIWWKRTLVGQRRELADWLRHQIYGIDWAITGIDHRNPKFFALRQENLYGGEILFDGQAQTIYDAPHPWQASELSLDVIAAGIQMSQEAEVVLINEPIFRSSGVESELRYNFYYPRWAYDDYRRLMREIAQENGWQYADLWDVMPSDQFTDTSLHLTSAATCDLAVQVGTEIQRYAP